MRAYSMIADHYKDGIGERYPGLLQLPVQPQISQQEFDDLKRQVAEMKELLCKAAEYDKKNKEPECEMEEKLAFLRKVAEFVGIPDAVKPLAG